MKVDWVGKMRLGMAKPVETTAHALTSTHAYLIFTTESGDTWFCTSTNPNPIMLCGRQETIDWEDEGEQNDGIPSCKNCVKALKKQLRELR